jgi:hypothetical protein
VASKVKPCEDLSVTEVKDMCTVMEKVCLSVCLSVYRSVCVCVCVCVCVTEALRAVMEKASPIVRAHVHASCEQDAAAWARARAFARVSYAQAVHMCLTLSSCCLSLPHSSRSCRESM